MSEDREEYNTGDNDLVVIEENQHKWYTQIPNIVLIDMDLKPFELAAYVHLKRIASDDGACWQNNRNLAQAMNMSTGKLSGVKQKLQEKGLIEIIELVQPVRVNGRTLHPRRDGGNPVHIIKIVDIWPENNARYRELYQRSPDEQPRSGDELTRSPHETKNLSYKNLPSEEETAPPGAGFTTTSFSSSGIPTPDKMSELTREAAKAINRAAEELKQAFPQSRNDTEQRVINTNFQRVVSLFENTIGTINPHTRDRLVALSEEYPMAWVVEAFEEAKKRDKRSLAYIEKILDRKSGNGKSAPKATRETHPEQARLLESFGVKRPGADLLKLDPEYIRGWMIENMFVVEEGKQDEQFRVASLVQDLRYGADVPIRAQAIAELTFDNWYELLMCIKAIRQRSKMDKEPATEPREFMSVWTRIAWEQWSRLFTEGPSSDLKRHYALKSERITMFVAPETLEDAMMCDVDEWVREKQHDLAIA